MDAVIRAPALAAARMRLSESIADPAVSAAHTDAAAAERKLRAEIEAELRAALAREAQDLYRTEHERARAAGQSAAVEEARAAAARELEKIQAQLTKQADDVLATFERACQCAIERLEASVGEIAFAAVCRLLGAKAASHELVLALVEQTCAQVRAETSATARLHPRDMAALGDLLRDRTLRIRALGLELVADESLELGGCIVEAASGIYDGGLETQLRRLHAILTSGSHGRESPDDATHAGSAQR